MMSIRFRGATLSCVAGSLAGGCAQTQFASDPNTTLVAPLHQVIGSIYWLVF